jgi:putative pyrroloquinoline-quinone binding quinoprotein
VTALDRGGASEWTAAPPLLAGPPSMAAAGALLVVRDPHGALVALSRDGGVRWTRAGRPGEAPPGAAAPAVARGTIVVPAGDGLVALDARDGALLAAVPGAAPERLVVDASLGIAAMDADGLVGGWRLVTHLSVL